MRGPRFKFPDEVRSTTRTMASSMVREGRIAQTPEQLDQWISEHPDAEESLRRGGYDAAFTSHDLFPLLQVFVEQAGGQGPRADAPAQASNLRLVVVVAVVLLLVFLVLAVMTGVLP